MDVETKRIVRLIALIAGIALTGFLLYALQTVILLVLLSIFAAYAISPLVDAIERPFNGRIKLPRTLALAIVYVVTGVVATVSLYAFLPRLVAQLEELLHQAPAYVAVIRGKLSWLNMRVPAPFRAAWSDGIDTLLIHMRDGAFAGAANLRFAPWLVLVPVITFFLLKDAGRFRATALQVFPQAQAFLQEVSRTLAAYVRAQLFACLFIAIACCTGFVLLGLPYAFVVALLAGAMEVLPLIGPLFVMLLACTLAATQSAALLYWTAVFLLTLRCLNDYLVYPRIVGSSIGLHPLVVILTIVCGDTLMGVPGVLLAIPLAGIGSVVVGRIGASRSTFGSSAETAESYSSRQLSHE